MPESLFEQSCRPCNFIKKETLAQVNSFEFFEISKNTVLHRTSPVAASEAKILRLGCNQTFIFLRMLFV